MQDFVGRSISKCRTDDWPFSFFGVGIGADRKLLPTHYTIRNGDSYNHVVKNWKFEASIDGINWDCLDIRIYQTVAGDPAQRQLDHEHRELRQPGGSLSFQIDTQVYSQLGSDGYRFFKITQLSKNSNNSDVLCLSGFELYGTVSGSWN